MPRFYFDLREEDGTLVEDEEGMSLPDLAAAEREATRAASEIAQHRLLDGDLHSLSIDVRDHNGDDQLSVTLSLDVKRSSQRRRGRGRTRSGDTGQGAGPP